ncbi:hypothetical protein MKX03_029371 [Papaver bracteatum]|nr:hypothetical protein MKX03_029371 [Papaver bracteatum]
MKNPFRLLKKNNELWDYLRLDVSEKKMQIAENKIFLERIDLMREYWTMLAGDRVKFMFLHDIFVLSMSTGIFNGGNRAHLAAVSSAYRNIYGSLKKAVKSETSGNFEFGLLTILKCAENPAKYFAKELYKSMKGLGTTDSTLIRIVVTRTEIDMQYIKAEYHKKFHKSLADAIHSGTSSHYRTFLLSLVD